jgi:sporulation protein YlmC with PRC-barrel domain
MERIVEHVELDSVRPGMTVTLNGREIGRVDDLILQPDGLHVVRLITRRASTGQRIAIPIEWVRGIQDGRVVLLIGTHELGLLPDYNPPIPARAAGLGVQARPGASGTIPTLSSDALPTPR